MDDTIGIVWIIGFDWIIWDYSINDLVNGDIQWDNEKIYGKTCENIWDCDPDHGDSVRAELSIIANRPELSIGPCIGLWLFFQTNHAGQIVAT